MAGSLSTGNQLGYQWYQAPPSNPTNFSRLATATNQTLTLSGSLVSTVFSGAQYQVVVSYAGNSVTSAPAHLFVETALQHPSQLKASIQATNPQISISFPAEAGHTYSLQYADDLSWPYWPTVMQFVPAAASSGPLTATVTPQGDARFYRIVTPAADP